MRSSSGISVFVVVMLCAALSACSSTIHDSARIAGYDTLSIDAKQRLVFFGQNPTTGAPVVCTEPSPDALVAISAALAAQGSATLPSETDASKSDTFSGGLGFGSSETAASIGMRTATIQVLRDGYYRLCEGLLNGTIKACEYERIIKGIDPFIATVMAVDAAGGMQRAPVVAVSGGTVDASAAGDKAEVAVTGAQSQGQDPVVPSSVAIGKVTVPAPGASQALAIRNIIAAYLNYDEAMRQVTKGVPECVDY